MSLIETMAHVSEERDSETRVAETRASRQHHLENTSHFNRQTDKSSFRSQWNKA